MVRHGDRSEEQPSKVGRFHCHFCGREVSRGDIVVGFKNENKPRRQSWDHVCAGACAESYRVPPLEKKAHSSTAGRIGQAVSAALSSVGVTAFSAPTSAAEMTFLQKARQLDATDEQALQVLSQFGGNEDSALEALAQEWLGRARDDLADAGASSGGAMEGESCEPCAEEPPLPERGPVPPMFSSNDARSAVADVFMTFLKPLLPKTQTDGSFKDGDAELLDQLMTSPCLLHLPRAERLADLVKMAGGGEWTDAAMLRARTFFALEAAGVSFLLYIPTVTHRQQLSRSPFFRVEKGGKVVGVRDCCPDCRTNEFVNSTEGMYNIRQVNEVSRNGVRFLQSISGCFVPISRTDVCRNPLCPPLVKALAARGIAAPAPDRALPRGEAPDGRAWPKHTFSTHSPAFIKLMAEALPQLGTLYAQYSVLGEGGCDATLAAKLMQTESTVAALAKELAVDAQTRERAALERYVSYMYEQQQLVNDEHLLLSPLELSRPSVALPAAQKLTAGAVAGQERYGLLPSDTEHVSDPFMRRWFELFRATQPTARRKGGSDGGSCRDDQTVDTLDAADVEAVDVAARAHAQGPQRPPSPRPAGVSGAQPSQTTASATGEAAAAVVAAVAPPWHFVTGHASTLTVSDSNIRTMMRHIHTQLKPYLTADLLKRHPGQFASSDHTFRVAARSTGDKTAYVFIMGEDHSIIWHGAVRSTSWGELGPALAALQRRFARLGVSGQLKYWWDDLCCRGMPPSRLHEHPVVHAFPGVTRCPRKDGFHGCQLLTSTFQSGTGEVDTFSRDVGQALRPVWEPDVEKAVEVLKKSEGLSPAEARREAVKRWKGKGGIRTYGPQPKDMRPLWEGLIERLRADRQLKGHQSIVRAQHGQLRGTLEQAESMLECIDKGCLSDPLPVQQMYIPIKELQTGLVQRMKKSESVKNETTHKGVNRLVAQVSPRPIKPAPTPPQFARGAGTRDTNSDQLALTTHTPRRPPSP